MTTGLRFTGSIVKIPDLEVGLIDMELEYLQPIQSVFQSPLHASAESKDVVVRMFSADAFVLVTPEYNGGFSSAEELS